jgi:uncharacterized protein YkwD
MHSIWKRFIIGSLVLASLFAIAGYFYTHPDALRAGSQVLRTPLARLDLTDVGVVPIEQPAVLPPPLRSEKVAVSGALTRDGIIAETNARRVENGFTLLTGDARLDAAAQAKVDDMFKRQFFEHVSPTGESASTLVAQTGYTFFLVGENLALGNYKDDQDVVTAWMNSEGHRENILRPEFSQIGIGIGVGEFEGEKTWLAVQIFATPQSECTRPSTTTRARITDLQVTIDAKQKELDQRKAEIEAMDHKDSQYNQKVSEYNALVEEINILIDELKQFVSQYNVQVESFNACANRILGT